jgi:hypothetical protein
MSIPQTNSLNNCTSSIRYYIDYIDYYLANNPGSTVSDVLDQLTIVPYSVNLCLPADGTASQDYILFGNIETGEILCDQNFGYDFDVYCTNIYVLSDTAINSFQSSECLQTGGARGFLKANACCGNQNNFTNCVLNLFEHFDSNELFNWIFDNSERRGIIEYGSYSNTFCELAEILMAKPQNIALEYLMAILEKGLVIKYVAGFNYPGSGILFCSIQTYYDNDYSTP